MDQSGLNDIDEFSPGFDDSCAELGICHAPGDGRRAHRGALCGLAVSRAARERLNEKVVAISATVSVT